MTSVIGQESTNGSSSSGLEFTISEALSMERAAYQYFEWGRDTITPANLIDVLVQAFPYSYGRIESQYLHLRFIERTYRVNFDPIAEELSMFRIEGININFFREDDIGKISRYFPKNDNPTQKVGATTHAAIPYSDIGKQIIIQTLRALDPENTRASSYWVNKVFGFNNADGLIDHVLYLSEMNNVNALEILHKQYMAPLAHNIPLKKK